MFGLSITFFLIVYQTYANSSSETSFEYKRENQVSASLILGLFIGIVIFILIIMHR